MPSAASSDEIVALERLFAHGWQGTSVRPLGQWLLRAGSGFTGRANSVLPLGDPGVDLDAALVAVTDFYDEHGLPAVFQLPIDGIPQLDADLDQRGWQSFNSTEVRTGAVGLLRPVAGLPRVVLLDAPDEAWLGGYLYRGTPLPPEAIAVLCNAERPVFAALRSGDVQAGVARGVVHDGWLGVAAVTVDPAHRRRGVGRHLMGELCRWAADLGARRIYLQVDEANTVARQMYDRLGLTVHHRYHYRRRSQ